MKARAAVVQAAVAAVLVGLMLILLGGGGAGRQVPTRTATYRPATEEERRQYDRELIERELDRLWQEWHPTPTASACCAAGVDGRP